CALCAASRWQRKTVTRRDAADPLKSFRHVSRRGHGGCAATAQRMPTGFLVQSTSLPLQQHRRGWSISTRRAGFPPPVPRGEGEGGGHFGERTAQHHCEKS